MAGKTWKSIGLAETRQIGKIVIDPSDPNRVYGRRVGPCLQGESQSGEFIARRTAEAHWKKILADAKDPR